MHMQNVILNENQGKF